MLHVLYCSSDCGGNCIYCISDYCSDSESESDCSEWESETSLDSESDPIEDLGLPITGENNISWKDVSSRRYCHAAHLLELGTCQSNGVSIGVVLIDNVHNLNVDHRQT